MGKFRKKPVVVEARQLVDAETAQRVADWVTLSGGRATIFATPDGSTGYIQIETPEGIMSAGWLSPGDWVIQGIAGEFYPCKSEIFDATYEPVD